MASKLLKKNYVTPLSRLLWIGMTSALLTAPLVPAQATGPGFYVGVGGGATKVRDLQICSAPGFGAQTCDEDDSDKGWKLFGGYGFGQYFAAELMYADLGKFTADATTSFGPFNATGEVTGYGLAAVGRLPIGERFGIFGKVGAFRWDLDVNIVQQPDLNDDGTDLHFGLGGVANLSDRVALRAEWERIQDVGKDLAGAPPPQEGSDVDLFSLSVLFRFGNPQSN